MGLCFSKKQQDKPPPPPQPTAAAASTKPKKPAKIAAAVVVTDEKAKKAPQPRRASNAEESAGKKATIVVKANKAAAGGEVEKEEEARPAVSMVVAKGPMPVRTSSCTKEEVDAILIQCGRLSRSSSGRAPSSDTAGGHRSKGSRDYDHAGGGGADEECEWDRHGVPVSRPSPHRGSPQRKRSGSRERTGGGSRRSSRSPGRRGEGGAPSGTTAGSGASRQQPGKMVSVPAREKGRAPSPAAASGKRCASPRSSSPARVASANENAGAGHKTAGQTPALSRSSSRKAEQSPLRRSPMAEIDENSLRNNSTNAKAQKKSTEIAVATPARKTSERAKEQSSQKEKAEETMVAASETRAASSKTTETRTVSIVAETPNPRSGRRSRRASRDLDQNPSLYATTQLLEDMQNYHTPGTPPSFTLPACVSKAHSIVEAVADFNSSSSESRACEPDRSVDDKASANAAVGEDEREPPSVHRYVSVRDIRGRGETELQESAGSNSLSGNLWTPPCESTDRTWSASRSSNNGDEVVEQVTSHHGARSPLNRPRQSKQRAVAQQEPSGRSRAGSSGVSAHRGRSVHQGSGRSGVRGVSAST